MHKINPGDVFGMLRVVARGPNGKHRQRRFVCACECGKETLTPLANLVSGKAKSCGCLRDFITKLRLANTPPRAKVCEDCGAAFTDASPTGRAKRCYLCREKRDIRWMFRSRRRYD